jgi:hypothetical protein
MLRPTSLLFVALFVFAACEVPHDEVYEKPITSLLYILTPDSGESVILHFMDRDGEGGRPAMVNRGKLLPETTYHCQLQLNSMGKHLTDSTSVAQEPELHQVFFLPQNGLQASVTYADADTNGYPIGLTSTLTTGYEASGQLTIIIKHRPNKQAQGVLEGDVTNAGGSTDLEVAFSLIR